METPLRKIEYGEISNFSKFFADEFPERSRNRSYAIFIVAKFTEWLSKNKYKIVREDSLK